MGEVTLPDLISRGIGVISYYFSNYINDDVLSRTRDFELIIIIAQVICIWLIFRKVLLYFLNKIWTFRKYDLWKSVITSSIDFISLILVLLYFRILTDQLSANTQDINLDYSEKVVIVIVIIASIYVFFHKVARYYPISNK
jgi:hypothetical protein